MTMEAEALAHVSRVVARSGSSFSLGMWVLPVRRRHAMFAIYAFCREVDDIADGPGTPAEKQAGLREWRHEVERIFARTAQMPTAMALIRAVAAFDLPREEFLSVIAGVEMDARGEMRAPAHDRLMVYCRHVAGAVGMLSIRVFGDSGRAARQFAEALGNALQLTNILRDIDEDAELGRLYLPRELLDKHGLDPAAEPRRLVADARIAGVCKDLAVSARQWFAAADRHLAQCNRARLRPALLMFGTYERILDRLEATGWRPGHRRLYLSRREKVWAALRQGLLRPRCRPSTS